MTTAIEQDPRVDVPPLVLRLERGSFSMLFIGDATAQAQAQADLLLTREASGRACTFRPTSVMTRTYTTSP
jgi:hypothetical protein